MWLFLCVLSAGCGVYLIYLQFVQYLTYSVYSTIVTAQDNPTEFPTITFCSLNYFNTLDGDHYANQSLKTFDNLTIAKKSYLFNKSKVKLIQNKLAYLKSTLIRNGSFDKTRLGLKLEDMILSCYFGSAACSVSDFEHFFDINYGNCYRFNSGHNNSSVRKVISFGSTSGLQLGLYLGDQNKYNKLAFSSGIYLSINNKVFFF